MRLSGMLTRMSAEKYIRLLSHHEIEEIDRALTVRSHVS